MKTSLEVQFVGYHEMSTSSSPTCKTFAEPDLKAIWLFKSVPVTATQLRNHLSQAEKESQQHKNHLKETEMRTMPKKRGGKGGRRTATTASAARARGSNHSRAATAAQVM